MDTRSAAASTHWDVGETLADGFRAHAADAGHIYGCAMRGWPTTGSLAVGCDLNPVDVTTADGRLLLTSFVWPFDLDRHKRLAAAIEIAASHPPRVDKAPASEWLPHALAAAEPDALTVVWHSITQMYWPADELAAVEAILASVGVQQPLGEVGLEFDPYGAPGTQPELRTQLWRPDCPRRLVST